MKNIWQQFKSLFDGLSNNIANPMLNPRKFRMSRPVPMGRHWMNDDPMATAFFNSLSISFPHAEVYMIDSLKPWREHVSEPMRKEINAFIQQELNHSREHIAFNRGMIEAGYEFKSVEKDIINLVQKLNMRDDLSRLQMTMCMEHLTAVISAELLSDDNHLAGAETELRNMWLWHATEEIEHKAVAYNVWLEATKDWSALRRWANRSLFFTVISYRFFSNRLLAQIHLLQQDGYSKSAAFLAMMRYGLKKGGLLRRLAKPWAAFYKVNFHPWSVDDRHLIAAGESQFIMDGSITDIVSKYIADNKDVAIVDEKSKPGHDIAA